MGKVAQWRTILQKSQRLVAVSKLSQAVAVLEAGLERFPNHVLILYRLGCILQQQGHYAEASEIFQKCLSLDPDAKEISLNLGALWALLGQTDRAIALFEQLIQQDPNFAKAYYNLARVYLELQQWPQGEDYLRKALQLRPNDPGYHVCLAYPCLRLGRYAEGFREYEWRLKLSSCKIKNMDLPMWDGSPMLGQTLLVLNEQGFGDLLQLARYFAIIRPLVGRLLVQCQPALLRLIRNLPAVDLAIPNGKPLPAAAAYVPVFSLPYLLTKDLSLIPKQMPYLFLKPTKKLEPNAAFSKICKVGLVWGSSPGFIDAKEKSIHLNRLAPVFNTPGVVFVSLQKGPQAADLTPELPILPAAEKCKDFYDTALVIQTLDLLITVDTAVAHLAGALGKPVWVLLSYRGDWRWMQDRCDSPWYPSMRLFRQKNPGDWSPVIDAVCQALSGLVTEQ